MKMYFLSFLLFVVAVTTGDAQKQIHSALDFYGNFVKIGVSKVRVIQELDDVAESVKFYLHTRYSVNEDELFVNDPVALKNSKFDPKRETKFVTHGWIDSAVSPSCTLIKDAFLKIGDFNVIVVDWNILSRRPYSYAAMQVPAVARRVAKMIDFLATNGMDLNTTTVVGHSLGAHIAGLASHYSKEKVNYVVGLDPALPLFASNAPGHRISSEDAENVEIIHTNSGLLGFADPIGKADFYPNGGKQQLGCEMDPSGTCSHARAYEYFAESLVSQTGFYGKQCPDNRTDDPNLCNGTVGRMGSLRWHLPFDGVYYVATSSKLPFAIGNTWF